MDKLCNRGEEEDSVSNLDSIEKESRCGSPVFKCFNSTRSVRGNRLDSSEYDIPSYQINQKRLDRTSVTSENDNTEPVLPFTPVFSPIAAPLMSQFQPPSIHSLGTVNKFVDKMSQNNCTNVDNVKSGNIFESLGMTDKDISWVSSMASPPPKKVPGSELNTVEKKTLLPEEKFQSIQPRALFSPSTNDDSECHPLVFTPENGDDDDDDDDDEEYKTNVRLSDVCATLKDLNVKSFEGFENLDVTITEDNVISPVIKARVKKSNKSRVKKKKTLVLSPNKDKQVLSLDQTSKTKTKSIDGTNLIEDDSFQSMSFSCIDELCKSLMSDKSATDSECDKTLVNSETSIPRKFYTTKTEMEVHAVSTIENLHSYAKALEDGNQCLPSGKKIDESLTNKGIVRFDILNDDLKVESVKRLHSDLSEKSECGEKKLKRMDGDSHDNSSWERAKQYLSESQLNISDGEIFRTVENLEKTLASQKMDGLSIGSSQGISDISIASTNSQKVEDTNLKELESGTSLLDKTKQEVQDIFDNSDHIKKEMDEETITNSDGVLQKIFWENLIKWFSTSFKKSSFESKLKPVVSEVVENSLEKEKMDKRISMGNREKVIQVSRCSEVNNLNLNQDTRTWKEVVSSCRKENVKTVSGIQSKENTEQKKQESSSVGFATASGNKVIISDKALEKAKELMKSCDEIDDVQMETNKINCKTSKSTAGDSNKRICSAELKKENILLKGSKEKFKESVCIGEVMKENLNTETLENETSNSIAVGEEDVKAKPETCEENKVQMTTEEQNFQSVGPGKFPVCFSTASGKSVTVSDKALERAQKLMEECEGENPTELALTKKIKKEKLGKFPVSFSTASGKTMVVSDKALEKARRLMEECEKEHSNELESTKIVENKKKEVENFSFGFSTASGKSVTISDKALERARKLMEECEAVNPSELELTENIEKEKLEKFPVSFSTASGKTMTVSDKALEKARKLMEECEKESSKVKSKKNIEKEKLGKFPVSFSTASGKSITVSDKAVEKAQKLMEECEEEQSKKVVLTKNMEKEKEKLGNFSVSFSTASGNKISISDKALEKAKKLKDACEEKKVQMPTEKQNSHSISSGKFPVCFSTASGKSVTVSDKALERAQKLMEECEEEHSSDLESTKNVEEKKKEVENFSLGFSTASGKSVTISDKALERARKLMEECEENWEETLTEEMKEDEELHDGAQDKHKTIERDADCITSFDKEELEKGATKISEAKRFPERTPKKAKDAEPHIEISKSPIGFKTASGSKIAITSEALEKTKTLLKTCEQESCDELAEIWMEELALENAKDKKDNFGFATAAGNKVTISDEALEKGKTLMKACEESSEEIASELVDSAKTNGDTKPQEERIGFTTASGSRVTISDEALKKAKAFMQTCEEEAYGDAGDLWMEETNKENNKSEFGYSDTKAPLSKEVVRKEEETKLVEGTHKLETQLKEPKRECLLEVQKISGAKGTIDGFKTEETEIVDSETENEIPEWLHVYNTSPSMVSDRIEFLPIVYHSEREPLKSFRGCVVKSPVIGPKDRFYGRKRKRKLEFDEDQSCKRPLNSSMDFSAPFKKAKLVEEVDVKSERARAREKLDKIIREKEKVKPVKGLHYRKKCEEKQTSLMEAVGGCAPEVHPDDVLRKYGVTEEVADVNVDNAGCFKFVGMHFFGSECHLNTNGYKVADDCLLILDDENQLGFDEIEKSFLASPGVQPNLIPFGWLKNHYKWIIWKLSHYEKSFPKNFGGRSLTPENVLLQLKYRYDREIDRNERSALKKILERDDASCKRMVLCVSGIKQIGTGNMTGYELELTDGWYSCPARSDFAMKKLIEENKICIGTKMVTQGASLVNCEQGISPLEMSKDVYLKISTNSTRRIKWDAKLGFQRNPENFPVSLRSILPQGGQISRIDVIIVRTYPVLYLEKTQDGQHVTRNRRGEEKAEEEFRRVQEKKMETFCSEIQQEMRKNMEKDGKEDALECQLNQSDRYNSELAKKIEEKLQKEKLNKRNVSEYFKAKMVDLRKPDFNNPAVLSVWNPNEELVSLIGEGKVFSLLNVTTSNSTRTYKTLQINTTRQTQFRLIPKTVKYPSRKATTLSGVSSRICPAFEEVDLVGLIASIRDVSYGSRLSQIVYLMDFQMNFVGIVFWGSRKDYGWETLLKVPSIVACSNLHWRKSYCSQEVPSLYVNESSVFTENPRQEHLKTEMEKLKKDKPKNLAEFLTNAEEVLTAKLENSKWPTTSISNESSLRGKANGFESGPTASSTPIKPFQTRMKAEDTEPSPIEKRIEKLQRYGEPPSLIPLVVKRRKFKS